MTKNSEPMTKNPGHGTKNFETHPFLPRVVAYNWLYDSHDKNVHSKNKVQNI